jgi:CheY-like chemotaxis protein
MARSLLVPTICGEAIFGGGDVMKRPLVMVLNKMRLHPQTTHIPVVIASTTTRLLRDNEQRLRSKGCDILPKPFNLEELLTIVGKYVPPTT